MPVFHGTLFQISEAEMIRYAGLPRGAGGFPKDEIRGALMEAAALAEPRGLWEIFPYDAGRGAICGDPPLLLEGSAIKRHLSRSVSAAVIAVTAGAAIEETAAASFREGRYVRGLLLDAAATAIAEHLADQLDRFIQEKARSSGQKPVWRFSPGYGDWPVEQQKALTALIGTEAIGLSVTDHAMLIPRKSVTAVIGLSPCAASPKPEQCSRCFLRDCAFRMRKS